VLQPKLGHEMLPVHKPLRTAVEMQGMSHNLTSLVNLVNENLQMLCCKNNVTMVVSSSMAMLVLLLCDWKWVLVHGRQAVDVLNWKPWSWDPNRGQIERYFKISVPLRLLTEISWKTRMLTICTVNGQFSLCWGYEVANITHTLVGHGGALVGCGGALVKSMTLNRRVVGWLPL